MGIGKPKMRKSDQVGVALALHHLCSSHLRFYRRNGIGLVPSRANVVAVVNLWGCRRLKEIMI